VETIRHQRNHEEQHKNKDGTENLAQTQDKHGLIWLLTPLDEAPNTWIDGEWELHWMSSVEANLEKDNIQYLKSVYIWGGALNL